VVVGAAVVVVVGPAVVVVGAAVVVVGAAVVVVGAAVVDVVGSGGSWAEASTQDAAVAGTSVPATASRRWRGRSDIDPSIDVR
jgi:hypothetical protein